MKDKSIRIGVNSPFDLRQFNKNDSSRFQRQLKEIYKNKSKLSFDEISDGKEFDIISINSKRANRDLDDNSLIYEVVRKTGANEEGKPSDYYEMNTGIFVGCLIVGGQRIVIDCGYGETFFHSLLKQANNIYVDSSAKYAESSNGYEIFNVIEYLFLSTLKSAINFGVPKRYIEKRAKGWDLKGEMNIGKYLSSDSYKKDGISYRYRELSYDSDILNVLLYALGLCDKRHVNEGFKEVAAFANQVKTEIQISKPDEKLLNRCLRSPILYNGLYSKYRKALVYAEMIIKHNSLMPDTESGKKAVGWIVDISELWEDYIYHLLKGHYEDWIVSAQKTIELYNGTFYRRNNYPDIIMERDGHLVILDAKYKKMDFKSMDVDRNDLHQVQSYYGYYSALGKYSIDAVLLVYPARDEPTAEKRTATPMFGIENCKTVFDIGYIKVGKDTFEQQKNEEDFIARLDRALFQEADKNIPGAT